MFSSNIFENKFKTFFFFIDFLKALMSLNETLYNNYNKVWGTVRVNLLPRIPTFLF